MGRSTAWVRLQENEWLFRSLDRHFIALLKCRRDSVLTARASVVVYRQSFVADRSTPPTLFKVWQDRQDFPLGIGLSKWVDEIREMVRVGFYLEDMEKIALFLGLDQRNQAGGKVEV